MGKIYLASASPRRKELLSQMKVSFDIFVSDAEEITELGLDPIEIAKKNSKIKALAVSKIVEKDAVIIGADTIVVLDNLILGKPKNKEDAINTLNMLSGRKHTVITAVTIIFNNYSKTETVYSKSDVYFKEMSHSEIINYVETGEPMDKAGSYGIQGLGGVFVERIEGDYNNIVGLPINLIYDLFKKYNIY